MALFTALGIELALVKIPVTCAALGLNGFKMPFGVTRVALHFVVLAHERKPRLLTVVKEVDFPFFHGVTVAAQFGLHLAVVQIDMTAVARRRNIALKVSARVTLFTINIGVGAFERKARHGVIKFHARPVVG